MVNALKNLNLTIKLPLIIVLSAMISSIAVGVLSYQVAKTEINRTAANGLSALLDARASALSGWFETIRQDMITQADNPATFNALAAFKDGWQNMDNPETTLKRLYIDNNSNKLGEKHLLDYAQDGSAYSAAHKAYHPSFRTFLTERGYYDIFLFDTNGTLVYSVFKENDYATNLNTGPWKDTDLGNAFRAAMTNLEKGRVNFFDFKPYAPSYDAPASFVSTPLIEADGTVAGVLVFQMPIDTLNAVMQESSGMGETGETYAVGADALMRSDSRYVPGETTILKLKVDQPEVTAAIAHESGTAIGISLLGHDALIAYRSVDLADVTWALLAEKAVSEVEAPVAHLGNLLMIGTLLILALIVATGLLFARSIVKPITQLITATRRLADGDKSIEIPGASRTDEIGDMAGAVQVFKEASIKMEEMNARQMEAEKNAAEERERAEAQKRASEEEARRLEEEREAEAAKQRKQEMLTLADRFEQTVMSIVSGVTSAAEELNNTANSMTQLMQSTDDRVKQVSERTGEANANVQAISAAADELSASIENIGKQAGRSSTTSNTAKIRADETNTTVNGLSEAATRIGDVIGLIKDIAEQTNLLALNATIESARAGEAGKGFAVVASEVKNLATQTGKATEDIASQIESIQSVTGKAADDISEIVAIITDLNAVAEEIANVTHEQNQATIEITQSIGRTANSTNQVASDIKDVMGHVVETSRSADEVLDASNELAKQSVNLQKEIEQFLQGVRAA